MDQTPRKQNADITERREQEAELEQYAPRYKVSLIKFIYIYIYTYNHCAYYIHERHNNYLSLSDSLKLFLLL